MRYSVALLLLVILGCGVSAPAPGPVAAVAPAGVDPKESDHDVKEAVRAWLRENLDAPTWQETRWTVVSAEKYVKEEAERYERILKEPDNAPETVAYLKKEIAEYKTAKNPRFALLKLRSQTSSGGFAVTEHLWVYYGGTAYKITDESRRSLVRAHF